MNEVYFTRLKLTGLDSLAESLDTTLATKADINRLELKLTAHDGDFQTIKWMMGVLIAVAIANFAKQFF